MIEASSNRSSFYITCELRVKTPTINEQVHKSFLLNKTVKIRQNILETTRKTLKY